MLLQSANYYYFICQLPSKQTMPSSSSSSMERSKKTKRDEKQELPPPSSAPWLIYTHGKKAKKLQTFCTISPLPPHNQSYVKSIPELCGFSILASLGSNWLILRSFTDKKLFSLWNIVTSQQICLPKLSALDDHAKWISACALIPPPDDDDDDDNNNDNSNNNDNCAVLLLFYKAVVFYCRLNLRRGKSKTLRWLKQRVEIDGKTVGSVTAAATCNEGLYALAATKSTGSSLLINIDFVGHNNSSSKSLIFKSLGLKLPSIGQCQCVHANRVLTYLLESCGKLYFLHVRLLMVDDVIQQIFKVFIWELDCCQMSWDRVECLGNRAFFLGTHCSTWCRASESSTISGFQKDCVYFVRQGEEFVYSYKLKDGSFSFLIPHPNWSSLHGPAWVILPHQRLLKQTKVGKEIMEKVDKNLNQGTNTNAIGYGVSELEQQDDATQGKGKSLLSEIPADIITLISKYLHLFDYMNLRASCKTFQSTVSVAAQWQANNLFPFFLFAKDSNGLCELRDVCRKDSHSIVIPHSPAAPTGIEFSKDGWLVLCTGGESFQFLNPFTRARGDYPPYPFMHSFESVGFSTCPTSSDCLTVGINDAFTYVIIACFQSGNERWQRHDFNHGDVEFVPGHCSPVYFKEAFYFLDQQGYLGEFKLVREEASWQVYDRPQIGDYFVGTSHLVECDGELLSVFIGKVGRWIQVFKFKHTTKNWEELQSLGNHVLFVGHRSSFSVMARGSCMENRIYLPWRKGNGIIFYSLETGQYHSTLGDKDAMANLNGMEGQSLCCWI